MCGGRLSRLLLRRRRNPNHSLLQKLLGTNFRQDIQRVHNTGTFFYLIIMVEIMKSTLNNYFLLLLCDIDINRMIHLLDIILPLF